MPKRHNLNNPDYIQTIKTNLHTRGCLDITVRVTPKSQDNAITAMQIDADQKISLHLKIRGIPSNGEVNRNLCSFLAKELELGTSQIKLRSGQRSRTKIITLTTHAL